MAARRLAVGVMMRWLPLVIATALVTMSAIPARAICPGDCNADAVVTIDELILAVDIALGAQLTESCIAGDINIDGQITIDEIVFAVRSALDGCPATPTATTTASPTQTSTAPPTGTVAATLTPTVTATPTPTVGLCNTMSACLSGPAGDYCCSISPTSPGYFPPPLESGCQNSDCAVKPQGQTPYCDTRYVCLVPANTPTLTPSSTPTGPTLTPTPTPTIGVCAMESACSKGGGSPGQYCCSLTPVEYLPPMTPFASTCPVSPCGEMTPGKTPGCNTEYLCQLPTQTPTGTPTATGTPTYSCTVTPTGSPTPTGPTPTPEPPCARETPTRAPTDAICRIIEVHNDADEDVWIGAVGGAVEPNCVMPDGGPTCLVIPSAADASCLACSCSGSAPYDGLLQCPKGSSPSYDGTAWTCSCERDADCGSSALCGPTGKCFWTVPPPLKTSDPGDSWRLKMGEVAQFCLPMPDEAGSPVWWGGGIFGRTGCGLDGRECSTADCGACANAGCPAGVGPSNPFAQAEFTLQTTAIDYYDVTIINGANLAIEMAPLPGPTAPPEVVGARTPTPTPNPYWCGAPGRWATAGPGTPTPVLDLCSWNFEVTRIPVTPTPGQALLLRSYFPCDSEKDYTGCGPAWTPTPTLTATPTGPTPTATPSGTATAVPTYGVWNCTAGSASQPDGQCIRRCEHDDDCSGTTVPHCNLNTNYCECASDADCPNGQYCGTQFISGETYQYSRTCGAFAGWWTADNICGSRGGLGKTNSYGALTCTKELADLLGCSEASCYNTTDTGDGSSCCGCGTYQTTAGKPLFEDWPTQSTKECQGNNPDWGTMAQPWIGYLKRACPTAYTYPYDDATSTFTCRGADEQNLLGYRITFRSLPTPALMSASPTPTP